MADSYPARRLCFREGMIIIEEAVGNQSFHAYTSLWSAVMTWLSSGAIPLVISINSTGLDSGVYGGCM